MNEYLRQYGELLLTQVSLVVGIQAKVLGTNPDVDQQLKQLFNNQNAKIKLQYDETNRLPHLYSNNCQKFPSQFMRSSLITLTTAWVSNSLQKNGPPEGTQK